jgi:hypothetical protein
MDLNYFVTGLSHTAEMIQSAVQNVTEDQARWKPSPDQWSILEVVNHLLDEEKEDFRKRLDLTLHQPGTPWPDNDPEGWVLERAYNQTDLGDVLGKFRNERQQSVAWLKGLKEPDWNLAYGHPKIGTLSSGELLCAWLAHDLLHLRQITTLHLEYVTLSAEPYSIRYALP